MLQDAKCKQSTICWYVCRWRSYATETVTAGNIIAVSGLRDAQSGSTISSNKDMTPFERIVHNSDLSLLLLLKQSTPKITKTC